MKSEDSFKDILNEFADFCRKKKRLLAVILALSVLAFALQTAGFVKSEELYICDKEGSLRAVVRGSDDAAISVPVKIRTARDGFKKDHEEVIVFSNNEAEPGADVQSPEDREEVLIGNAVSTVEGARGKTVRLPERLSDGTPIRWYGSRKAPGLAVFLLLPLSAAGLFVIEKDRERDSAKAGRACVRQGLPVFVSQLMLLLGSGMITYDAFCRIADGYEAESGNNLFKSEIVRICRASREKGGSFIRELGESSARISVREYSRIMGIIIDNQYRGTELLSKIDDEGRMLWEERKRSAQEQGKLAETKLALPLTLLLFVLIVITAAPAVMEM